MINQTKELNYIRTDHTGSLNHPALLRNLLLGYGNGAVSAEALREVQNLAVREVIARQEQLGLEVVNDGELRRFGGFQDSLGGAVTGFDDIRTAPPGHATRRLTGCGFSPCRARTPGASRQA